MLGKLTLSAIPFDNMIVMSAVGGMLLATAAVLFLITYYHQWRYLWREWLTSVDHKRIGIMYIIMALVMLLRGLSDAIMMRLQQALAAGGSMGYLSAEHFNQIFSAHGTIMIFFVVMPFLSGLINIIMPQQIGARDVAFPYLNALSLWLTAAGAMLVLVSLGVGEFSKAGWSGYTPLTETAYSPGVGVDYWIWSLQISGIGSTLTAINFLVTILKMRAPGMKLMRMPIFTWSALCTAALMVLSFPVLTVALSLLALDRYLGMHFFTNAMGGDMMMYINLFWLWGHPEVYIVVLPAFGIFSEVVATFSRKRLFGYTSMVIALLAIMVLSFSVWVHHFFTMGAGPAVNTFFGITTMIIAVPTGVKVFNWLFTMYRGRIRFHTPMLWTMGFIATFAIGGMAGVLLASPPADYVLHHSLFLIAHFHTMLIAGSLFGYFAGYSYWFPKAVGFRLDERWGRGAFFCWLIGFYLAFGPLYVLGFMGMPRRMAYYDNLAWHPALVVALVGTVLVWLGVACQVVQLIVSVRHRKALDDVTGDPWNGRTLEWATASPPAEYNFVLIPVVHDIDAFTEMKKRGTAYQKPERFPAIDMPNNTSIGFIQGAAACLFGFAMIWTIWWLAAASLLTIVAALIVRAFEEEIEHTIPAEEVKRREGARYRRQAAAGSGAELPVQA